MSDYRNRSQPKEISLTIIISGGNLQNIAVSARYIMWFMSENRKNTKPDSSVEVAVTCLLFPQSNRGVKLC